MNGPIAPIAGNEPPVDTALRELLPDGTGRLWHRYDGFWFRDGDLTQYQWRHIVAAAESGSTFSVLYLPGGTS